MNWIIDLWKNTDGYSIIYYVSSFIDIAVLLYWGYQHVWGHFEEDATKTHRSDGYKLMALGVCALLTLVSGEGSIEGEKQKRVEVEKSLQSFKLITDLSQEAVAGSKSSYEKLQNLAEEGGEKGARATERLKFIERTLAYYEQNPGLVLAMELSQHSDGKTIRLVEYPAAALSKLLEDESITENTRFSVMNDMCKKSIVEVDAALLELLPRSQYLPALAATTSILRRLHKKAKAFMDFSGWIEFLRNSGK